MRPDQIALLAEQNAKTKSALTALAEKQRRKGESIEKAIDRVLMENPTLAEAITIQKAAVLARPDPGLREQAHAAASTIAKARSEADGTTFEKALTDVLMELRPLAAQLR